MGASGRSFAVDIPKRNIHQDRFKIFIQHGPVIKLVGDFGEGESQRISPSFLRIRFLNLDHILNRRIPAISVRLTDKFFDGLKR